MYLALAQRFVRALPPGTPQGNTECCTTPRSRSKALEAIDGVASGGPDSRR